MSLTNSNASVRAVASALCRIGTTFAVATAILCLPRASVVAQFPSSVTPGTRVRLWRSEAQLQEHEAWHEQVLRATVSDVNNDTLRLEVASAFERAFALGLLGGISVGIKDDPSSNRWPNYKRDWRAAGEGFKSGAALGCVAGFVFPTERWHRIRLR